MDSLLNQGISDKEVERNRIKIIKALRSGKYTQIMGCVKSKQGHCFIGLAYQELGMMSGHVHTGSREDIAIMLNLENIEDPNYASKVDLLVFKNDSGQSFNTIANYLIKKEDFPNVPLQDSSNEVGQ